MKYFEECIFNIYILPSCIMYAIINKDSKKINQAKNIFNELYNLYISLNPHDYSLISSTINDYKKLFEIMYFKLKNSNNNVILTDDNKVKEINKEEVISYIIEPKRNTFTIKEENFINN